MFRAIGKGLDRVVVVPGSLLWGPLTLTGYTRMHLYACWCLQLILFGEPPQCVSLEGLMSTGRLMLYPADHLQLPLSEMVGSRPHKMSVLTPSTLSVSCVSLGLWTYNSWGSGWNNGFNCVILLLNLLPFT